jgi:hypothetical protein
VADLLTEEPERVGRVDGDVPAGEVGCVRAHGNEARGENGDAVRVDCGQAGRAEGGLGDGVVLAYELEGDGVAGLGHDEGRVVSQGTVVADDDLVHDTIQGGWSRLGRARVRAVSRGPGRLINSDSDSDSADRGISRVGVASGSGGPRPRVAIGGCRSSRSRSRGSSGRASLKLVTDGKSSLLEVGERIGRVIGRAVDSENHSSTTVAVRGTCGLITEHPDGLCLEKIRLNGASKI